MLSLRNFFPPKQFVVLQERSTGNETVGNAWTETATFPPTATLADVWRWAHDVGAPTGRTMIRPDQSAGFDQDKLEF
jgi:hypothetical protein